MIRYLLTFLLVASPATAQTVPFDPSRGLVELDVVLNDRVTGRFALDTGADWLLVGLDFALEHRLLDSISLKPARIVGLAGETRAVRFELDRLRIGKLEAEDIPAAVLDLFMLNANNTIAPPDGVLGYEFLRHYAVTVDPADSTVSFTKDYQPRPGEIDLPFAEQYHLVPLTLQVRDTLALTFVVDLGSTHSFLSAATATELGLHVERDRSAVLAPVRLGTLPIDSVAVRVTDLGEYQQTIPRLRIDGLLGWSFWGDYRVTIDYREDRVWVGEDQPE